MDTNPLDVEPLYHFIDVDTVEMVFRFMVGDGPPTPGTLGFLVENTEVPVYSSGEIVVEPAGDTGNDPTS